MPIVGTDTQKSLTNGNANHTIGAGQGAGQNGGVENGGFLFPHISSLPPREPIDIQFKDVTYTVNLGYFKGELTLLK